MYLSEELAKVEIDTALSWKQIIEEADITTDLVEDKAEAVQVFTFQNDRGKELTNLEKLKAALMLQIFLSCKFTKTNSDDAIRFVEREFETIYKAVERIEIMGEDALLTYHTIAFLGETEPALSLIKKTLAKQESPKKKHWIEEFVVGLKRSFEYAVVIQERRKGASYIGDILFLDQADSFPLLLKLFHYHATDPILEPTLRMIEIILFRLNYTTANYATNSLPSIAYRYTGENLPALKDALKERSKHGFQPYWNFEGDFHKYLEGDHHYWLLSRYLLWKYENHLRQKTKDAPMLFPEFYNLYGTSNRPEYTIDHWAPQNPEGVEYDEDFKERYLHNIGNLVLSSRSRNASDNNSLPEERSLVSTLISRQRLESYGVSWGKDQIKARQKEIVAFAKEYWNPQ